ncbi:MAG TPA: aminoacyl-tRNA hydrolase [Bacillota bacterium]|nr:aminoacyl-tRNA hydrolase [Bacillota bacterium]HQE08919.1 aminoacyl-tRNA hydrolase [Bacillota bacterium]
MGNPGERYCGTRHNLGYRVVEAFSRQFNAEKPFHLRHSLCAAAGSPGKRVLLVQPLTYMNLSGRAVVELLRRYELEPGQLVLVYDDLDLPPGRIRLRCGGGSAGHRGVQSVIDATGSSEFLRLRIGIGKPFVGEAAAYVLDVPPPQERLLLDRAVEQAVEALAFLIDAGLEEAMNRFNRVP